MNTATALFEIYKTLPKRQKQEFKSLFEREKELTLMQEIEQSLKEVKQMKEGKISTRTYAELKKEMQNVK